jgi:hypothetical protein
MRNYWKKVLDQSVYYLEQKQKHLNVIQELTSNTFMPQRDFDSLKEDFASLKNNVDNLSTKINAMSHRSLSDEN